MTHTTQLPAMPRPKFTAMIRGVPCITVTEHEHLMRAYALQARAILALRPAAVPMTRIKDGEIAAMVNSLRDIARQFHGHSSLREHIANVLVPALKAEAKTGVPDDVVKDAERYRWLRENGKLGFSGAPSWRASVSFDAVDAYAQTLDSNIDAARSQEGA